MKPTIKPNRKQHLAWQKLQDKVTEYVVYGGAAGGGKSWLGCEWILTSCIFYPNTKYFLGRDQLKDIRESTFQTWFKVLSFHGIKSDSLFRYNGQDYYFQFNNGSRVDLKELKFYPSDPLYERFGSLEYTSGWIEEAGEVDDRGAEMISSRTGRWMNDNYGLLGKTLLTCNPKKNFLYYDYYRPYQEGTLAKNKSFIQATVDDNDKGESGYRHKLENMTGVQKERLLYGNWEYDDDPAALIDYDKILDCFTNSFLDRGEGYITCDVARFGADSTVIGVWHGWRVKLFQYRGYSVQQTADRVNELRLRHNIPLSHVIFDEDGVGGGCVDILKGCKGFVNNSKALPNPVTRKDDNYANLKSQCYYRLAERINAGGVYIDCEDISVKKVIIQELEQVKQHNMDKDGKRQIIPKDKVKEIIGRSPDYSDTLMMREWFDLKPAVKVVAF